MEDIHEGRSVGWAGILAAGSHDSTYGICSQVAKREFP